MHFAEVSEIRASRRNIIAGSAIGLAAGAAGNTVLAHQTPAAHSIAAAASPYGISLGDFAPSAGDGDQSDAFARAYEAARTASSGSLDIPGKSYRLNGVLSSRAVGLTGRGNTASILRGAASGPILAATDADASWNTLRLADLGLEGRGEGKSVGLRLGNSQLTRHSEYTGRFILERMRFANFDHAIERPFGNIGFDIVDNTFVSANIHVWSRGQPIAAPSNDTMHAGALTITRGSMQGARRAAIYVDGAGIAGSGQIVIDSVRFQDNPGWVLWIENFNTRGPQPGVLVRNCWNEGNYTAASVEMGGAVTVPGFARLSDVPACTFEDTPIGPLSLSASHVITRGCNLDQLTRLVLDDRSSLTHHDARMFTGTARGLVRSVGHLDNTDARSNLNTPWFPMPPPTAPRGIDAHVILRADKGNTGGRWQGESEPSRWVNDIAIPWRSQSDQVLVGAQDTLISPFGLAIPAGAWIVVQFVARLVSGPPPRLNVDGQSGLGGLGEIRESQWRTYTAIWRNDGPAIADDRIYLRSGGSGTALMRIAGYAVTKWDSAQEALVFANALTLPSS